MTVDLYFGKARETLGALEQMLGKISYKPGWRIRIISRPSDYSFIVEITYEGYESETAAFVPVLSEPEWATRSRERFAESIGKTVRRPEKRRFTMSFDLLLVETMDTPSFITYVLGRAIRAAEEFEFNRWFRYEGEPIFRNKE